MKGLNGEDKKHRGSLGNGGALTRRFLSLGTGFDAANSHFFFFFFFENWRAQIKKGVGTCTVQVRKPGKLKSGEMSLAVKARGLRNLKNGLAKMACSMKIHCKTLYENDLGCEIFQPLRK